MPVVEVKWLEGRTPEQKRRLIEDLFDVFEMHGVPKDNLQVVLQDVPKPNWGVKGKQASDL